MKIILTFLLAISKLQAQNFTQFASDENHSFSFFNPAIIKNLDKLVFVNNPEFKKADWPTPVIFDDNIIYGTKDSFLISYNLNENKIKWKIDLNGFKLHSAPIIDIQNKKLYFLTSKWEETNFRKYKFNIRLKINEVGLDAKDLRSFEIDQDKYSNNKSNIKLNFASHCKNALGILKNLQGKYLYWGCSMYTDPKIGLNYRQGKGLTGLEYFVEIKNNGSLNFQNIFTFSPSMITSNPDSGFDTGIWNTGSKAINLKDGTILISTGNGPVLPKENNYGCSIIRLDTNKLKVKNYLLADTTENKECEYSGLDFSSSSINLINYINKNYAFTVNKSGNLWIFDPYDFNNKKIKLRYKFASHAYGAPLSFINNKNKLQIIAIGYDLHSVHPPIEFIAPADFKDSLKNYKIDKCIGYIPTDKNSKNRINLYYSGPELNDYIISNKKLPFYKFEFREYSLSNLKLNCVQGVYTIENHLSKSISRYKHYSQMLNILNIPEGETSIVGTSLFLIKTEVFARTGGFIILNSKRASVEDRILGIQLKHMEVSNYLVKSFDSVHCHEFNLLGLIKNTFYRAVDEIFYRDQLKGNISFTVPIKMISVLLLGIATILMFLMKFKLSFFVVIISIALDLITLKSNLNVFELPWIFYSFVINYTIGFGGFVGFLLSIKKKLS